MDSIEFIDEFKKDPIAEGVDLLGQARTAEALPRLQVKGTLIQREPRLLLSAKVIEARPATARSRSRCFRGHSS